MKTEYDFVILEENINNELVIASLDYVFTKDEYLVIECVHNGKVLTRVTGVYNTNRLLAALNSENSFVDGKIIARLFELGYDCSAEEVHIARIKILSNTRHAIQSTARIRPAKHEEILEFASGNNDTEFILGEITGVNNTPDELPDNFKNKFYVKNTWTDNVSLNQSLPLNFDFTKLVEYPHVLFAGSSGSGKSTLLRVFIEELMLTGLPAIVFDVHSW